MQGVLHKKSIVLQHSHLSHKRHELTLVNMAVSTYEQYDSWSFELKKKILHYILQWQEERNVLGQHRGARQLINVSLKNPDMIFFTKRAWSLVTLYTLKNIKHS